MKNFALLLALLAALSSESVSAADQILTFSNLGPVRIGMTQAEAEAALHTKLKSIYPEPVNGCWSANRADGIDGQVSYFFKHDKIVTIDVDDHEWPKPETSVPPVATERGIHIGDLTASLKKAYGSSLTINFHPQGNAGDENYLWITLLSPDKKYGLLFEIWEGKVSHFNAGTADDFYVDEPCI